MPRTIAMLGIMIALILAPMAFSAQVAEYLTEAGCNTAASDTSGSGNNADVLGNAVWAAGHGGTSEFSFSFDGDTYLEAPDSASLDSIQSGFSLSCWVYPTADSTHDTLVWKLGAFRVWKQGTNLMVSLDGVGTITNYIVLNGAMVEDTWQHIAVTYDGRYICGYYNGVRKKRVRENDLPVNLTTSNYPLAIGWYNGGTPHFRGMLDNVRLFNHALSATEVIDDITDDQAPPAVAADGRCGRCRWDRHHQTRRDH